MAGRTAKPTEQATIQVAGKAYPVEKALAPIFNRVLQSTDGFVSSFQLRNKIIPRAMLQGLVEAFEDKLVMTDGVRYEVLAKDELGRAIELMEQNYAGLVFGISFKSEASEPNYFASLAE